MRTRHVPMRRCVVCGARTAKRQLLRIVQTPEGQLLADPRGKRNGRGAYIGRGAPCWEGSRWRERLGRALERHITEEQFSAVAVQAWEVLEDAVAEPPCILGGLAPANPSER